MASDDKSPTCCSSATKCQKPVELGFVEKEDSADCLLSHRFPSKIGGRPAWLSLKPLPDGDEMKCCVCGKPCVFLLQAYCPIEDQIFSFHRTLFLFVCRSSSCSQQSSNVNFKVFRSQLPRVNSFYDSEPPDEKSKGSSAGDFNELCVVCGCLGSKRCGGCLQVSYCSKEHQTCDWKRGHKKECKDNSHPNIGLSSRNYHDFDGVLFPELEIVMDTEDLSDAKPEMSEEETLKEYNKYIKSTNQGQSNSEGIKLKDLEEMANSESTEDEVFQQFKERIKPYPGQVLRYHRGGEPLWVSSDNKPSTDDIPNCMCGAPRQFEFQVLPQLLNHLAVDSLGESLDWGMLAVFTCRDNCDIKDNYNVEFLWKQNFTDCTKK